MEQPPTGARGLWFAGAHVVVHVDAARSDGRLGVWESVEPAGVALPLHVHEREDEQVVVLDGEIDVEASGESLVGGPGPLVTFAPEERHAVRSAEGARVLLLLAPWPGEGHYRTTPADAVPERAFGSS